MMPAWYTPPVYRAGTGIGLVTQVARTHGFTVADLVGPSRVHGVCLARWRAMKALRDNGRSFTAIGRLFNRDHSSVIYGLRRLGE